MVDTEEHPPPDSWMEEFDHLETLVINLNDAVTSMSSVLELDKDNTAPHGDDDATDFKPDSTISVDGHHHDDAASFGSTRDYITGGMTVGVIEVGLESEGSDTSIVKENLAATDPQHTNIKQPKSGQSHSNSDSSTTEILEDGPEWVESEVSPGEAGQNDFDENLMELLRYADSADLHMV